MGANSDSNEQRMFLDAILERPDEFEPYGVYSDWLTERGDPLGELIRVQWNLEDIHLTGEARERASVREVELLQANQANWLRELSPELTSDQLPTEVSEYLTVRRLNDSPPFVHSFARGFLEFIRVRFLYPEFAAKLAQSPQACMLRALEIERVPRRFDHRELGWDESASLAAFSASRFPNLRELHINSTHNEEIEGLDVSQVVANAPRLEVLKLEHGLTDMAELFRAPIPKLRSLTVAHRADYPITELANNPTATHLESIEFRPMAIRDNEHDAYIGLADMRAICQSKYLTNLKHLNLRCTDFGDEGIEELLRSRLIDQLQTLWLSSGATTDHGVERLVSEGTGSIRRIDLSGNYLTANAIRTLRETGIAVTGDCQHRPDAVQEHLHLYDGYTLYE